MDVNKLKEEMDKAEQIGFTKNTINSLLVFSSMANKHDEYGETIMELCNFLLDVMAKLYGLEIIVTFINEMFMDDDLLDKMGFRMFHILSSIKLGDKQEASSCVEDISNCIFVYKTKLVAPAFYTEIIDVEELMRGAMDE